MTNKQVLLQRSFDGISEQLAALRAEKERLELGFNIACDLIEMQRAEIARLTPRKEPTPGGES